MVFDNGMARETKTSTTFTQAVEMARKMEHFRMQSREENKATKPHGAGRFSGASCGGKINFGRSYLVGPVHSILQNFTMLRSVIVLMVPIWGRHLIVHLQTYGSYNGYSGCQG